MDTVRTVVDGLHRDVQNHALISQDVHAYAAYKSRRNQQLTLESMSKQIQELRAEINTLKQLITSKIG